MTRGGRRPTAMSARARTAAREVLAVYVDGGAGLADQRAEVERWLAAHGR